MDTQAIRRNADKIFALCFFAYATIYIGRKNFGACMNAMIGTEGAPGVIDAAFGGAILTAFLAAYATGQLLNGYLGDRISPRYMISCGLLGAGCINVLMGLNSIPWLFLVLWCLCGLFCSMLWSPVIRCLSDWIPDDRRAGAGANISASLPAGTVSSYLLCALLLKIASWRVAFVVCGGILIAAALFFFFAVGRMKPYTDYMERLTRVAPAASVAPAATESPETNKKSGRVNVLVLIFSSGVALTIVGILFNGILKDGLESWVPTYLSARFGASESLSSLLTAALPIVSLTGVYFTKWLYSRFCRKNEMLTSGVLFTMATVLMLPLVFLTAFDLSGLPGGAMLTVMIAAVLLIALVISLMLGVNTMYLTFIPLCFGRVGRASSVTGFLNACSYGAAALSGVAIGFVSQHLGWTATIIAFTVAAAAGAVAGFSGTGIWARGKARLSAAPEQTKED